MSYNESFPILFCACLKYRYKVNEDCEVPGNVVVGRCSGFDDYDTSRCIACEAQCVGWQDDPQGRGQFISR
jgi:hypothetical protein